MATITLEPGQKVYNEADIEELFRQRDIAETASADKEKIISAAIDLTKGLNAALPGLLEGKIDMGNIMQMAMGGQLKPLLEGKLQVQLSALATELEAYQAKYPDTSNLPALPAQS